MSTINTSTNTATTNTAPTNSEETTTIKSTPVAETQSTEETTEESTSTSTTPAPASNTSVSSRAESLATLNSEFAIMSPDFQLTQEFVNRMAQLDLISGSEAEKLGAGLPSAANGESGPTVGEMKSFAADYISELEEAEDAPTGLLDILKDAEKILANLDSSNPDNGVDIAGTAAALKDFIESEEGLANDETKDKSLRQLHNMLIVADSLTPANRNSESVNAYIKVMQGL